MSVICQCANEEIQEGDAIWTRSLLWLSWVSLLFWCASPWELGKSAWKKTRPAQFGARSGRWEPENSAFSTPRTKTSFGQSSARLLQLYCSQLCSWKMLTRLTRVMAEKLLHGWWGQRLFPSIPTSSPREDIRKGANPFTHIRHW